MTLTAAERQELDLLLEEQAADLEWLSRVERTYPLAVTTLWTAPAPMTGWDQRRSVAAAMTSPEITVIEGGWRSGKSEGCKELALAWALGGDHPAVRAWLELNGLPPHAIPDGPEQVYAIAQSSNDSIRYHRPDFERMVGQIPHHWSNRSGKGEALLELYVPGYERPGKIWFKSIDQGRRAYQGISIRGWWCDEDPEGDIGEGVIDECMARVADQSGRGVISMIPLAGMTWVQRRFVEGKERGCVVARLDTLDNPHLPRARFESMYAGMTADDVATRRFGMYRARAGVIYPMYVPGDGDRLGPGHVVEDFEIPDDWPRFRAADFGLVNPTCVLWGALGDDDTLYIYREYYVPSGESYAWHARQVAELEVESVEQGWGDPAAREAREEFTAAGVHCEPADNDVKGGIDQVRERMRLQGDNRPRLKVFRRACPNLQRELPNYVWDPKRRDEVPVKKDDHAADALRYLVMGLRDGRIECW